MKPRSRTTQATLAKRAAWWTISLASLALFAVAAESKSKTASSAKSQQPASLADPIQKLLTRPQLQGTVLGIHVVRLSDGKSVFAHQADRQFLPASNAKLLTTAAALTDLGPDYQFRTEVGIAGRDLVVVGGGDPTIGGRLTDGDPTVYFRRWAKVLKEHRLRQIAGNLLLDDAFFDRQHVHPKWPKNDLGHWYAAPVAALALNDSCVDVRIAPGPKAGAAASVWLIPNTRYFELANRTHTAASTKDHTPRVARVPGSRVIQCDGGVYLRAQPSTSWVAVDDPVQYFGTVLREVLAQEGVKIAGEIRRAPGAGNRPEFQPRVMHRFRLLPALAVTNKESQNFYAEQILKTMGAVHGDGSWEGGRQAAAHALSKLGLDTNSYVLDDGCGLSRSNRASPRAFTTLLVAMHRSPHAAEYRETLAVAGVDGTMSKRLAEEPYRGHVWAKTGSISGVRAISGYVLTRSDQWLAFSLLINNVRSSVRTVQDDFCKLLVNWEDQAAVVRREREAVK